MEPWAVRLRALGLDADMASQAAEAIEGFSDPAAEGLDDPELRAALALSGRPTLMQAALVPLLQEVSPDTLPPFARGVWHHLRALAAWRVDDDPPAATAHLNRSLDALEPLDTARGQAYAGRVLDTLGQLLLHRGILQDARLAFERALQLKARGQDGPGIALTQGNLGRLCMALGDFRAAVQHLQDDLVYVERQLPDASGLLATLHTQIASCRIHLDDLEEARTSLDRATDLALATGDPVAIAFAGVYRARAALRAGETDEALTYLEALAPEGEAFAGPPEVRGLAALVRAQIHRAKEDLDGALTSFEEARNYYDQAPRVTPVERAELQEAHACAAEAAGRNDQAADLLRAALRGLDATSAEGMRRRLDDHLRRLDRNAWMLHSSGRFVGHGQLAQMLDEAGRDGFRGRMREAAVLFSDLRGFTAFAEALDAEALVAALNRYFSHMTRCVETFGGRIDKFIGDAVMAIFMPDDGAQAAHHAERAARAAVFMQEELDRFNRFLPAGIPRLAAGVGVHAGLVVSGLVGSPQKRSYTVLGDVVNTASRLEGMSKILNAPLLLSAAVADAASQDLRERLLPLGRYRPHGRVGAVEVYVVDDGNNTAADRAVAQEALAAFHARSFDAAHHAFKRLHVARGGHAGDKGYALHARFAKRSVSEPPDADWDGAIVLTEK